MNELRALTVRHPWAWAIARGGKRIENRTWRTRYRGPLAIHAAARIDREDLDLAVAWADLDPGGPRRTPMADAVAAWCRETAGSVVAYCRLVDCLPPERFCDDRWAMPGCWHWVLDDVEEVDPVPARGRLGLWTPDWRIDYRRG